MSHPFMLEVITPDRVAFNNEVTSVLAPGVDGYFGVLAGHQPMIAALAPGTVKVETKGGREKFLAIAGGFFQVQNNEAVILVESAEWSEEINLERAKLSLQRAKDRLAQADGRVDRERAEEALARAKARLKATESRGK